MNRPNTRLVAGSQASASKGANGSSSPRRGEDGDRPSGHVAEDMANIFAILKQISGEMQSLGEIRKATSSMEEKLTTLMTRIGDVEGRLGFLEDAETERKANPPATKSELEALSEKVDDMEDRSRRNNLRFVGFPEGCEAGDTIAFLEKVLPEMLDITTPSRGWFIERAHRLGPRTAAERNKVNGRTLIARFMRTGDRDRILHASQEKGETRWEGKRVMIFPDFSRGTVAKRDAFKECKKMLHQRGMKFALQYPATLRIDTKEGPRRFMNPRKAMDFIRNEPRSPPEAAV